MVDAKKEEVNEIGSPLVDVATDTEPDDALPKDANVKNEVPQKVDYTGAQVWKVNVEKSGARQLLRSLRRKNCKS